MPEPMLVPTLSATCSMQRGAATTRAEHVSVQQVPGLTSSSSACPPAQDLYWRGYCEQRSTWAVILKQLVTSLLPSLLLTLWTNMVMIRLVYYLVQVGGRAGLRACGLMCPRAAAVACPSVAGHSCTLVARMHCMAL